jgi:hypothetical protein
VPEQATYRITWPVPVTFGDAHAYVISSVPVPEHIIVEAVKRVRSLSEQCPAGGVLPTPQPGETWGLLDDHGITHTGTDETLPRSGRHDFTLVLLDAHGAPYDPEELVETRPQAVPA